MGYANLEWDEELTNGLKTEWEALIQSLRSQNKIEVGKRFYEDRVGGEMVKEGLHAFSDGSVEAYGTSIFKSVYKFGYISVCLVSCKSRVVPMKSVSITRYQFLWFLESPG